MFRDWDWIRQFDGKNQDWRYCLDTICADHSYSDLDQRFLEQKALCQDPSKFDRARPRKHYLCRIFTFHHWSMNSNCCTTVVGSPSHFHSHIKKHAKQSPDILKLYYKAGWCMYKLNLEKGSKIIPAAPKPSIVEMNDMEIDYGDNDAQDEFNFDDSDNNEDNQMQGMDIDAMATGIDQADDAGSGDIVDLLGDINSGMLLSKLPTLYRKFTQIVEPKPHSAHDIICRPCISKRYQIYIHQQYFLILFDYI